MKILSRYILREHVGPFTFALTALTSLMLLNFISRQFGELVGKGLPASVIGEFFLLSIPFTVALTLPMSVLVAVLYAFSRLAAENEVTALKASGVSPWRLVTPAIMWGVFMSAFLLAFNDQVLPRANHRLKTLQDDIAQTKPTFLLKPQVINPISEGRYYLKAGTIDPNNGRMREIVIHDLADPMRRRTIYADSGTISMAGRDLYLDLFHGQMQELATDKPAQLDRLFYDSDRIRIRDVTNSFKEKTPDASSRGDRELGVCEMQKRLRVAEGVYQDALRQYNEAKRLAKLSTAQRVAAHAAEVEVKRTGLPADPHGIGWAYCAVVSRVFGVKAAQAAELPSVALHRAASAQDTVPKKAGQDTTKKAVQDTTKKAVQDTTKRLTRDTTKQAVQDTTKRVARDTARDTTKRVGQDTSRKIAQDTARKAADSAKNAASPGAQPPAPPRTTVGPAIQAPPSATGEPRVLINGVLVDPRTGLPAPPPPPLVHAPSMPPATQQPGVVLGTSTPGASGPPVPMPYVPIDSARFKAQVAAEAAVSGGAPNPAQTFVAQTADSRIHVDIAQRTMNGYEIEIHKKFSLAAACLIFVVLGAPIALRFPRGGVGLVIGVSLVVFALYYVGLIGGEALARKGFMPPFWAMWGTNVILTIVGIVLLLRMGREENSGRGGDWGDRFDRLRNALLPGRRPQLTEETA